VKESELQSEKCVLCVLHTEHHKKSSAEMKLYIQVKRRHMLLGVYTCATFVILLLLLGPERQHQSNPTPRNTNEGPDVTMTHQTVEPPTGQPTCCELMSGFSLEKLCLHRNGSTQLLELKNLNCSCTDLFYCRLVVMTALDSDHYKEVLDSYIN